MLVHIIMHNLCGFDSVIYIESTTIKGGCAHFDVCNFHFKLIDLDP